MTGLAALVLDCRHAAPLARFWSTALGWSIRAYDDEEVVRLAGLGLTPETDPTVAVDAPDGSVTLFVVEVPEGKAVKNRMHPDIRVRDRAHLDELLRLGARVTGEQKEMNLLRLADPEGNEFCVLDPPPPC